MLGKRLAVMYDDGNEKLHAYVTYGGIQIILYKSCYVMSPVMR
jgi:hypothetical protein